MKYIQDTIGINLILSIYKSGNIKWYVDTAFVVHKDMMINTGGFIAMKTWWAYVQSRKENLNTNNSTETDIFGVGDVLNKIISTQYSFKEQGFEIHDNVIYQDNQSAIKPENNGRQSSSKRTRHITTI